MTILRIDHPIPDFDGWREAFDSKSEAEALLATMREVWRRAEGQVDRAARVRARSLARVPQRTHTADRE